MAKEKIVTIGEKKYKFVQPTLTQSSSADFEFSKAYTAALVGGLLPKIALEKRLIEAGAWSTDDDAEIESLNLISRKALQDMALAKTAADKDVFLEEYQSVRTALMRKLSDKQALFTHTAEAKGDEAKIIDLMWQCVVNEDGSRIWGSKKDFLESNISENEELLSAFISYISGLDDRIKTLNDMIKSSYEQADEEKTEDVVKEEKVEESVPDGSEQKS